MVLLNLKLPTIITVLRNNVHFVELTKESYQNVFFCNVNLHTCWYYFINAHKFCVIGLNGDHKNVSDQERFSLSCDIFTKGLQEVAESDKNDLWRAYIDHLVEGYKKNIVSATDVEKWFSQAHDEKGLSESQYGSWLELSNDNQVESIFKKGSF